MLQMLAAGNIRPRTCPSYPRELLASYLDTDSTIRLVGSFASGDELLQELVPGAIDVLLLDVRMPNMDGPSIATQLATHHDRIKIIYLSSYPDEIPVDHALDGTVMGALTKAIPPETLTRAVHLAADGVTSIASQVRQRHHQQQVARPPARPPLAQNQREQDVLDLLCKGYTNEQIGSRLHRSASSVKQILGSLSQRAGVHSRTELVLYLMDASFTPSSVRDPRN
ncbi:response regulator [Luteococcus sp. OSA5]|uniref:response regulator n=1 Tax=Luteococcus sp. OSA5 TaxID=3401630 RepID=UPI003B439174